mmetsp:Transcript_111541/g.315474  ORF Transcript_111541/g.315474 Transcript_111541/m.315474 type:complete len:216 (-) Transcript_111541:413-1060(-)
MSAPRTSSSRQTLTALPWVSTGGTCWQPPVHARLSATASTWPGQRSILFGASGARRRAYSSTPSAASAWWTWASSRVPGQARTSSSQLLPGGPRAPCLASRHPRARRRGRCWRASLPRRRRPACTARRCCSTPPVSAACACCCCTSARCSGRACTAPTSWRWSAQPGGASALTGRRTLRSTPAATARATAAGAAGSPAAAAWSTTTAMAKPRPGW